MNTQDGAGESLERSDPEIFKLIKEEEHRQKITLSLVASENQASTATLEAQASVTANKLADGYPGNRGCAGCEVVDRIERLAIQRARKLFGAEHANVQCPAASQANLAVYTALLKPNDTVLAAKVSHGGHYTHGSMRHISAGFYNFVYYGLCKQTEQFDFDEIRRLALKERPKLIIVGMSSYPRIIDFASFREIADSVGAYLMADIAHIVGLIIADVHPSPVPYADVVTTSTHKTFGGPRGGGLILCKRALASAVDAAVFPGTQGAPVMNIIASRAVLFKEAMSQEFRARQIQTVQNAKALAANFSGNGMRLVTGGTDNHLILMDLRPLRLTGQEAEELLYSVGIATNRNTIPFDNATPPVTSGLRLGTVSVTMRGMMPREMTRIGDAVSNVLTNSTDRKVLEDARREVRAIAEMFPQLAAR
jgi:glycine hydroxymethyltransferase